MIYRELPTAFIWYDNIKKQSFRQENLDFACYYGLVAPKNALLPFQLKKESLSKPTNWIIVSRCGGIDIDISSNVSLLKAVEVSDGIYVTYNGENISFNVTTGNKVPLNLSPGEWYSILTFEDGQVYYSDLFKVVDDVSKYVKLEFYDGSDLSPIKYLDTDFKQVIFLDSVLSSSEPEIEEEGENDENGLFEATFQRLSVNHTLEVYVPDFLKIALTSLQMHSNILLTSPSQAREGIITRVIVSSASDPNVGYSTVTMQLVETNLIKNSCDTAINVVNSNPWV